MIDLAVLWLVVWLLKTAVEDVSHAVKGTTNPRYEAKAAKARAAGQTVTAQPRYGSRDWFGDLLSDGLQAQTEWRRRRAQDKRDARDRQDNPVLDAADEPDRGAGRGADPVPEPEPGSGSGSGRGGRDTGSGPTGSGERPGPGPAGSGQPGADPGDVPVETDTVQDTVDLPRTGPGRQSDSSRDSGPPAGGAADPDAPPRNSRQQPQGEGPTATVIPFPNRSSSNNEESDVATEVIGLDQSIGYARNLQEFAGQHGSAGNEGYIGHLQASKVGGDALQSAHEMQAAFDNAQALAERHAAELEKQKAVQEQYDANPDAGDKNYQQEGR